MEQSSLKSSTVQARQIRSQFVNNEHYLSYELGQAVKKLPSLYTRLLAGGISLIVLGSISWAYFSQVDEVAVAQGKLVPSDQMRPVRSLGEGTIREVKVTSGDRVDRDDLLIERDSTYTQTEIDRLEKSAQLIREDIARLEAERTGIRTAGVSLQDQLLAARLQDFEARRAAAIAEAKRQQAVMEKAKIQRTRLQENLANAKTNLANAKTNLVNAKSLFYGTQASLEIARNEERALESLLAPGAIPKLQYLRSQDRVLKTEAEVTKAKDEMTRASNSIIEAQDKVISLEKDLAAQKEEIRQAQQAYQGAQNEANRLASERQSEILARLNHRREELTTIEGELAQARKRLEKEFIKAPIGGIVYNIKASAGPVQTGEELLSILPEGEEVILEVNVLNRDIGFIAKGMPVKVKIATFPFQEFGTVNGEVMDISADAILDENLGLIFPVKVQLDRHSIEIHGQEVDLVPGMGATGEIVTRKKSILSFLIEPVARRLSEAFSVR